MGETLATSKVVRTLATMYADSRPGRTGQGARDFQIDFRELLRRASCEDGDARAQAVRDLMAAEAQGIISLDRHRRDLDLIEKVRLPLANEAELFAALREPSLAERRNALVRQFAAAAHVDFSERWRGAWDSYMSCMQVAAERGESIAPFSSDDLRLNDELLTLLPRLLAWEGDSLIRFASCVLCGDSKRLGELSNKISRILSDLTSGEILSLERLGILDSPRSVLLHGPLRLQCQGQWIDLSALTGTVRLSEEDITKAKCIESTATRCMTVENETTFHELAKLRSGVLLVCTSFPGSGTLAFLHRLPDTMEFWHFGDTDPAGFDILRDLRERTGKPFKSLHMRYRPNPKSPLLSSQDKRCLERLIENSLMAEERESLLAMLAAGHKGRFEQESLGRPMTAWPFYT